MRPTRTADRRGAPPYSGDRLVAFTITAVDDGLSGRTDVFGITLSDGYQRSGTVVTGNFTLR